MIIRFLASLMAIGGLVSAPLVSDARILVLPGCGGPSHIAVVPGNGDPPDNDERGCNKACHAVSDRRGKERGGKRSCC